MVRTKQTKINKKRETSHKNERRRKKKTRRERGEQVCLSRHTINTSTACESICQNYLNQQDRDFKKKKNTHIGGRVNQ